MGLSAYPCHNGTGTHHCALTYRSERHDDRVRTDDDVCLDSDGACLEIALRASPLVCIDTRCDAVELYIRSDDGSIPNVDDIRILESAIRGNSDLLAEMDIVSILAGQRGLNHGVGIASADWSSPLVSADLSRSSRRVENGREVFLAVRRCEVRVTFASVIVCLHCSSTGPPVCNQFWVDEMLVAIASQHLIPFRI